MQPDQQYIQFLKNMIKFSQVFGGQFKIEDLQQELRQIEVFETEQEAIGTMKYGEMSE